MVRVRDRSNQKVIFVGELDRPIRRTTKLLLGHLAISRHSARKTIQMYAVASFLMSTAIVSDFQIEHDIDENRVCAAYWLQIACQVTIKAINLAIIFNQPL